MKRIGAGMKMDEGARAGMQPLVQLEETVKLEDTGDSFYQDMDEQSIIN